jgi:MFS-type transporter involved in bile tolerance (Atg22 family)
MNEFVTVFAPVVGVTMQIVGAFVAAWFVLVKLPRDLHAASQRRAEADRTRALMREKATYLHSMRDLHDTLERQR